MGDLKNPVLRVHVIQALEGLGEYLRAERRTAILELRLEGWTWRDIGAELGVGKERAWQIGRGR